MSSFSQRKLLFALIAVAATLLPSISAVEYTVGDDKGWTINFDYQAWAQGKEFHVGDKLVFKYPESKHNVLKVNGTGFAQCAAPVGTVALTSGSDVITLATEGRKWYICGVAKHCEAGNMKLVITVLPEVWSPAPAPGPWPAKDSPSSEAARTGSTLRFGFTGIFVGLIGALLA